MGLLGHARSSVRVRVTAVAVLAAMVVAVIGVVVFVRTLRSNLEQGLVSSSVQEVEGVQARLAKGVSPSRAVVSGRNDDLLVQIVNADGSLLATDHARMVQPLRTSPGTVIGTRIPGLEDRYVVVARAEHHGDRLIVVGRSAEHVGDATSEAALLLVVAVPIGLLLVAGAVWLGVGRALRPVDAMRRNAAAITSADLAARLPLPSGSDEIPRLARTLNEMLDRIDSSQRAQRRFVSDASHELRTPLAAMRQLAQVARDYPDRVRTEELAGDVLAEEQRMEELVRALLLLARMDDGARLPQEPIDLDDLLLAEVRRVREVAGARIDISEVSAGQVLGDPVLLRQVVRNLISNALRHARSTVTLQLHERDGEAVLVVDDDGDGIAAAERERVFERFVRLDESRARDAGGAGLGLAIVRTVVDLHGGGIEIGEAPTGGARFVVSLPLSR